MTTGNTNPLMNTKDKEQFITQHKDLMDAIYQVESLIGHIALPDYLTNEQRDEWRQLFNEEQRGWRQIADKCGIELFKEEWYDN